MNALCCQKVWDLFSGLTWQHAFSVLGVTLAANQEPNPGKLTVGAYPCDAQALAFFQAHAQALSILDCQHARSSQPEFDHQACL